VDRDVGPDRGADEVHAGDRQRELEVQFLHTRFYLVSSIGV
jgi:hypothetical protein